MRERILILAVLLVLTAASRAAAVDGVVLINSASAAAGGVTSLDTAGFPVSLNESGSYRLASNLTVPDANTDAIRINADNVDIDLNGFSIIGATSCSWSAGTPPSVNCSGTGTGKGVVAISGISSTVRNGRVRGMGNNGVQLGDMARVEDVDFISNGGEGLVAGVDLHLSRSLAFENGVTGFVAINGRFVDNRARRNGNDGIAVLADSSFSGNVSIENGNLGLLNFSSGGAFSGNIANSNGSTGIGCGNCTVTGNTTSNNQGHGIHVTGSSSIVNNVTYSNDGNGIQVDDKSVSVIGNTVVDNVGTGIVFLLGASGASGYSDNLVTGNTVATVTPLVLQLGTNVCGTNTTCP